GGLPRLDDDSRRAQRVRKIVEHVPAAVAPSDPLTPKEKVLVCRVPVQVGFRQTFPVKCATGFFDALAPTVVCVCNAVHRGRPALVVPMECVESVAEKVPAAS